VLKHESTIKILEVQLHDETLLHQSIVKHHSEETQAYSKSFCFTFQFELTHRQAKNTKIEELSSQVDDLSKLLEHKNQENKGLIEEKASVSQLQDQHSIELAKHKTKLDDACKHYQNTLKEEQSKLQLVNQELELSKSDIVQLKTDANRNTVALEAQKEESMELQGLISSLQQDLAAADLEKQSLKKLLAESSHLVSVAQQNQSCAQKHRAHDLSNQPQPLTSALKASASSAGAQSARMPSAPAKKTVQHARSFNPSASPPPAAKHRDSPKTKKRDRSKVNLKQRHDQTRNAVTNFAGRRAS
jgi:chromosome segregation ATPase